MFQNGKVPFCSYNFELCHSLHSENNDSKTKQNHQVNLLQWHDVFHVHIELIVRQSIESKHSKQSKNFSRFTLSNSSIACLNLRA